MEVTPQARPSAFRRFVAAPFWAGLLGAGAFLWILGCIVHLEEAGLLRSEEGGTSAPAWAMLGFLTAVVVSLALGWRTPLSSYLGLFGRLLGGLVFAGFAIFVAAYFIQEWRHADGGSRTEAAGILTAGLVYTALAVGKLHRQGIVEAFRAGGRRRGKLAALGAVLGLATASTTSAPLRCYLGSGKACGQAGDEVGVPDDQPTPNKEEARERLAWYERGCARKAANACGQAAWMLQKGLAVPRDLGRAEDLYGEGCALGDSTACGAAEELALERRCDRFSATACRKLADDHARGSHPVAARFFQKACLLGDDEACRRGR